MTSPVFGSGGLSSKPEVRDGALVIVQERDDKKVSFTYNFKDGRLATKEDRLHSLGPCTYADADGDLIFSTFDIRGTGKEEPEGTKEYIGGTGKYAGLTGHATFTTTTLKPMDKDSPHSIEGHVQGTYKLGTKAASAAR